ncbi:uncharacterized protein LOC125554572 [Triticum urartu]|uniref:uncharacterized protein LOC125554572 n=1 Tax=Triticum urartu TaxID=4572 RepID=UPI0020439F27|nr:uncharacterized protein LOC125554572 [Triticum urartu]
MCILPRAGSASFVGSAAFAGWRAVLYLPLLHPAAAPRLQPRLAPSVGLVGARRSDLRCLRGRLASARWVKEVIRPLRDATRAGLTSSRCRWPLPVLGSKRWASWVSLQVSLGVTAPVSVRVRGLLLLVSPSVPPVSSHFPRPRLLASPSSARPPLSLLVARRSRSSPARLTLLRLFPSWLLALLLLRLARGCCVWFALCLCVYLILLCEVLLSDVCLPDQLISSLLVRGRPAAVWFTSRPAPCLSSCQGCGSHYLCEVDGKGNVLAGVEIQLPGDGVLHYAVLSPVAVVPLLAVCLRTDLLFPLFGRGSVCHRIGSLLPNEGDSPKYAELYIHDRENEVNNRIQALNHHNETSTGLDKEIVKGLIQMLDANNSLVKKFRMASDILKNNKHEVISIRLIAPGENDGAQFNLPATDELAALVYGEFTLEAPCRDLIIRSKADRLHRISSLDTTYMSLQYPLLFPYGERGF